jgi:hypothetical protein
MLKRNLLILIFGVFGLISFLLPLPVFSQPGGQSMNFHKVFTDHYGGTSKEELTHILEKQETDKPRLINIFQYTIRKALDQNIEPTTVLILLSLPLIGILPDVLHYMVGLKGYGIYMPTMIAAALWSVGIIEGIILFVLILAFSLLGRNLLYRVKLHYWPRRTISLWLVVLGIFLFLGFGAQVLFFSPGDITAFSVLFLILLSEEHISNQRRKSVRVAIQKTIVTLVLAVIATLLLSWYPFQELILVYPEIYLVAVLIIGVAVGRYTGFRLLEFRRFRSAIRKEKEE